MATVRVQCAWCRKNMGTKVFQEKENKHALTVSHSICPSCYAKVMRDIFLSAGRNPDKIPSIPLSNRLVPGF